MLPIVLIHGYSSEGKNTGVEDIYGNLPGDLREKFGALFEHANTREGTEGWIVRLIGTSVGEYHKAIVVVTSTGKIHSVNCHRAPQ